MNTGQIFTTWNSRLKKQNKKGEIKMKRYLIKVTYLEGAHKGRSYLLRKGGYVEDEDKTHYVEDTYKTYGTAQRVCRHLYEENELSRKIEREDEAVRIKRGRPAKEWYIYESEAYEPFEVEAVDLSKMFQ